MKAPSFTRRHALRCLAAGGCGLLAAPAWAASVCTTGRRQSPVDITNPQPGPARPLVCQYHPTPLRLGHDGHTIRLRLGGVDNHAWLGRERLNLQQAHFHLPGGDTLRGESFPMAMHWPHHSPSGQLVTLVTWFRLGQAHPGLAPLWPHLCGPDVAEHDVPGVRVQPLDWLPAERSYFAYDGSLTSEPCTEGVRWVVLQQPQELSTAQLARLRQLIAPNARAVQPLNGRVIRAHA